MQDQDTAIWENTGEERGHSFRHVILQCWESAHQDIVPEENSSECWDLTPEGSGAEKAAAGAPIPPEKQANQKPAWG